MLASAGSSTLRMPTPRCWAASWSASRARSALSPGPNTATDSGCSRRRPRSAVAWEAEHVLGDEVERELLRDRRRPREAGVEIEVEQPFALVPCRAAERLHHVVCGFEQQIGGQELRHVRLAGHFHRVGPGVEACRRTVDEQPRRRDARMQRGDWMLDRLLGADRLLTEDRALTSARERSRDAVARVAEAERGGHQPLDVRERPQDEEALALGSIALIERHLDVLERQLEL